MTQSPATLRGFLAAVRRLATEAGIAGPVTVTVELLDREGDSEARFAARMCEGVQTDNAPSCEAVLTILREQLTGHGLLPDYPIEPDILDEPMYSRSGRRQLSDASVRDIRNMRQQGVAIKEICTRYGVKASTVSEIAGGKIYRCVSMQ